MLEVFLPGGVHIFLILVPDEGDCKEFGVKEILNFLTVNQGVYVVLHREREISCLRENNRLFL